MLSIYKKDFVEEICKKYCDGVKKDVDKNQAPLQGMVIWLENRVEKYCTSTKREIKTLKSKLTNNKIQEILEAKPENLTTIWKEFESFKDLKLKVKDENTILQNIFDYDTFRGYRISIINGFWLAKELGVDCCPYCNRNYTTSHQQNYDLIKKENKYVFPCFDHFYPKEVYPLLALSFYNLIPSCTICNSDYKGTKDPNSATDDNYKILNPYNEFINDHFSFDFIPQDYKSLVGKDKIIDLTINYKNPVVEKELEKSITFFGILENYGNHKNLIQDIIDKKITFSDHYIKNIESIYGLNFNETYKILFETHYEDDQLYKLPFSKLKKDIYDKLEDLKKKSTL